MTNYDSMMRVLTDNIRMQCKKQHLSITNMERELGFSPGLISRWTKSKTSPAFDKIYEIAEYLKVSIDDLLRDRSVDGELGEKITEFRNEFKEERILEQGILSPNLKWCDIREDETFSCRNISNDVLFENFQMYQRHYCYYTEVGTGILYLSIMTDNLEKTSLVNLFVQYEEGGKLEKVKVSEIKKRQLLEIVNPSLRKELYSESKEKFFEEFKNIIG